jgi:hypothetical protein
MTDLYQWPSRSACLKRSLAIYDPYFSLKKHRRLINHSVSLLDAAHNVCTELHGACDTPAMFARVQFRMLLQNGKHDKLENTNQWKMSRCFHGIRTCCMATTAKAH